MRLNSIVAKISCFYPKVFAKCLLGLGCTNFEKIFYLNHIKKNYVVFDLGANRGYFTKLFCNIVGPCGEVHAFEPIKQTYIKNLESFLGKIPSNLKLNNLAVGDRNTDVEFFIPGSDDGQASLKPHCAGSWRYGQIKKVSCKMIRLEEYIQKNKIAHIDFIKCDIEGAELFALRGMLPSLKRHKPKLLLEVNEEWTQAFEYTAFDLINFLKEVGYKSFYKVDETPIFLSEQELKNLSQFDDGVNIFCT